MRCATGRCLLKTTQSDDFPEVLEMHKLSGNSCAMLRVRVASMRHLEGLFEGLGDGGMNTHVVLSTEFEGRPVQPLVVDARLVSRSAGWGS
jgi:Lrp/AsnC family leucine-responsive transcriptional regulator